MRDTQRPLEERATFSTREWPKEAFGVGPLNPFEAGFTAREMDEQQQRSGLAAQRWCISKKASLGGQTAFDNPTFLDYIVHFSEQ